MTSVADAELRGGLRRRWNALRSGVGSYPAHSWFIVLALAGLLFSSRSEAIGLPVSLDRLFIPAALVLLVLDRQRRPFRMSPIVWMCLAYVVWIVFSMASTGMIGERFAWFALVDRDLMPFILFVTGALLFDNQPSRELLLKALTLIGLYLGGTALLEMAAPQLVFPSYIVDPDVGQHYGRARGPFAGAEGMGLALVATGAAAFLLYTRGLRGWRVLSLVVGLLCAVGVLLAQTRSVWVGFVVALVVLVIAEPRVRRFVPHVVIAGAVAVGGALAAFPFLGTQMVERIMSPGPVYDRLASNSGALNLLYDLPLTGIGWRRFYPHGSEWVRQSDDFPLNHAIIEIHNVILSRAVELGIPAAMLFVAIIVAGPLAYALRPATGALRDWRRMALVVVITWIVAGFFGPLATPFPNYVVWLLAGVGAPELMAPRDEFGNLAEPPMPSRMFSDEVT